MDSRGADGDGDWVGGGVVFTSEQLAEATGGKLWLRGDPGSVSTDSRELRRGARQGDRGHKGVRGKQWFLALKGDRFDGKNFVPEALGSDDCAGVILEQGGERFRESARAAGKGLIVSGDNGAEGAEGGLACLHGLAKYVRSHYEGKVVGITGSCGKTTTRAMVRLTDTRAHAYSRSIGDPSEPAQLRMIAFGGRQFES